jgi:exodeoxyribonuclease V gamma subunit
MFILHTSNRTERLARCLASIISQGTAPTLFRKELFLIQSRGMEKMLAQYLSEHFGVWANSDYMLPIQFIDYLGKLFGLTTDDQVFNRDALTWQLERLLRDTNEPPLKPLAAYLAGHQSELKRFQLARQLADVFDQYQIMRMDILEAWEANRIVTHDESEVWQKELWRKIRSASPEVLHRGALISGLINQLQVMDVNEIKLPRRILVFGLHTMPPLFLSALNTLSAKIDVHLFLLSPCELYWGDIESRRVRAKRILAAEGGEDSELVEDLDYHPLLVSFGRQGAHFQELLLDRIDVYREGEASFVDPLEGNRPSLLHLLQRDILAGSEPEKGSHPGRKPDSSIQVISCHSRMRELMVLKDQILSWMYEDQSLELHEIIVMAPDIQEYALLVPAVFDDIHHTIADRNVRRKNRYFDAFMQFLGLFSGRYGWTEIVSILERPEVFPQFSMSAGDLETIRHWVIQSGIRWGLSGQQRLRDTCIASETGTWRSGLERMLMGYAIDSEEMVAGVLPFTGIEGGNGELLGGLCQLIDIVEQSSLSFADDKTLAQWSDELRSLCSTIFAEPDHPDLLALNGVLTEMGEKYLRYHSLPVSFQVIETWLRSIIETCSSGGFLSGKLTFCSMLPMRSIPFRMICLLGLNEGSFPRQDYFSTFNLMEEKYRHGDRSTRADDRYQFLEAIIAARERLYLSYIGQSIRTNKKIPPAVVVNELLDCLQIHYGVDDLTAHHPLQPSDWKYFSKDGDLFSYDEHFCQVASNLHDRVENDCAVWLQNSIEVETQSRYHFSALIQFFTQPQIYFVRHILGINPYNNELFPDDDELFSFDNLSQYSVQQEIVESLLRGTDSGLILARLQTESRWPLGTPGLISFEKEVTHLSCFVQRICDFKLGLPIDESPFELDINGNVVEGILPYCYQNGQLLYRYAGLKGKDLLIGWLYHLVAARVRKQKFPTYILARDYTVVFDLEMGNDDDLRFLFDLFVDGCCRVSSLLVEPSFSYAQQHQLNRTRGQKEPMAVARQLFSKYIENHYVPEWNLIYRNQSDEDVLSDDFEALCQQLMVPLWETSHVLNEEH